jgi:Carboxypeptidase regulatory-like domain
MKTSHPRTAGLVAQTLLGLAVLLSLIPLPAAGQAVTGTILGRVADTSGAVIPGAKVTVTQTETGFTRTLTTDAKGEYTAPSVPTGTYTVTGELTGFKTVSLANVHLGVDQKLKLDLKLDVGQMTETVEIQAETPLLQTSSSDLSATIDEEQIKMLPLNGRNFVSLTRTIPGILRPPPGANIDGAGSLAWRAGSGFSANGQRPRDNSYLLDGVDNNETWLQTVVIFPSVDALDEFKMQTSTYSAEFGKSLGGVVNLQIKSGSNRFHGSAYDFNRNDAFDANNFFNNKNNIPKADFKQNQFGATLGGPVVKDKTFFFASYQGLRLNQGVTKLSTVPTEKMRSGDFSEINRVIYDPLTGQPFPGNTIPASRWDPASANIMDQLFPAPNVAGRKSASGQTLDNYLINPTLTREDNQLDAKIDQTLSPSNRFFVRYSFQKTNRDLPAFLPHGDAGATFGAGNGNIKAQGLAFNDSHTFSPNLLNEFRFGWTSIKFFMTSIDYGTNIAEKVGIPGINLNQTTSAMTQLTFQNVRNIGANSNQPLITNQNDFQLFDNITKIKGRHTFKVGASITFRSREILNADTIHGQFQFNNNQTSNCAGLSSGCTINTNTGFDVASFLLGSTSRKIRNLFDAETYTEKRPEWAVYVQDDFHVNGRLTLNYGLRWDLFVPWVEVDDRQSNFDESTGTFVLASPNAVVNGVSVGRYLQTYGRKDFGPRFGFAYDVSGNGKTLVRGGIGLFWNFTPGGTSSSKAQNPPFLQATDLTSNVGGSAGLVSVGLPAPPGVDPNRPAAGTTRSIFDVGFRDGYTTNWNLNVQRQIGRNYMVEVAYVGSAGRQMVLKGNPNQAPPVVGVTNSNVNRPYASVSPALRDVGQVRAEGTLDYHALQVKFQRRFANGFSFFNSYTWGQGIDLNSDNDGSVTLTNVYDPQYNRGPSDYDIKHTFVSNLIYALPWAKTHPLGGWQVSGILYWRSGRALTISQQQGVLSTGTGNRPDTVSSDFYPADQSIDQWFNPDAWARTADLTGTYGNTGRNTVRGPGQFNIDMALFKNTKIGRTDLELRFEAFNVLNHPQFADPNTSFGNAAFGTITSMLPNPACALCGTTERNVQISAKLKF